MTERRIPPTIADVTPRWLTAALVTSGALRRGRVVELDREAIGDGHGMLAELWRIRLSWQDADADAPVSVVAKLSSPDPAVRERADATHLYEREVRFYQEVAGRGEVPTPRCYFAEYDPDSAQFVLLLEDLRDARTGDRAAGCTPQEVELSVHEIARLHAAWWDSDQLPHAEWLVPLGKHELEWFDRTYAQKWNVFVDRAGAVLSPGLVRAGERLGENLIPALRRFLAQPPLTLVHLDYHADNLLFTDHPTKGLSVAIVDWQYVSPGRGVWDVATLVGGSLESAQRRELEEELLPAYYRAAVEAGGGATAYSYRECHDDYRLAMLVSGLTRIVVNAGGDMDHLMVDRILPRYIDAILELEAADLLP